MNILALPSEKTLSGPFARKKALPPHLQYKNEFPIAPKFSPATFVSNHFSPGTYKDNGKKVKFDKGTTTLAFKYQGGIIVAVDSRASQGSYVSSQTVQKVIPITDKLIGTMAGGAADCLYWQRNLGMRCRLHQLRNREEISVRAASKMLVNVMNQYKGSGLSIGSMVIGSDNTGEQLYYVDNDASRLEATKDTPYFSVGSGSTFAYGILDTAYRWDMTEEEAIELGRNAIYHATSRDGASGGVNNVYSVSKGKWRKLEPIDVYKLHEDKLDKMK
eukprot:snap_masked-scaffold_6-processed-gene-3.42-mRNA-1 protein AED:0.00 eAED:0.00 QI:0/-1/0/1/-1/1/1/0/273